MTNSIGWEIKKTIISATYDGQAVTPPFTVSGRIHDFNPSSPNQLISIVSKDGFHSLQVETQSTAHNQKLTEQLHSFSMHGEVDFTIYAYT